MSISAANSAVLRTAPAPQRLGPGQQQPGFSRLDTARMLKRAGDFVALHDAESNALQNAGKASNNTRAVALLAEDLGIHPGFAFSLIQDARAVAAGGTSGYAIGGGGASPSGGVQQQQQGKAFSTVEEAKSFALASLDLLKLGIENFNRSVRDWTPAKAQEAREKSWQGVHDGFLRSNPHATEQDAVAFADKSLKNYLQYEGRMDDSTLNMALGRLQSAFASSGPLYTTNDDGTLTLNSVQLSHAGNLILEIGADIGQKVDKAA